MSAILAVFGSRAPVTDEQAHAMLGRMTARGAERTQVWRRDDVVLAVGRYDWEMDPAFSDSVLIAEEHDVVIAADASLYYRNDLRRALAARGIRPGGDSAPHLILAAWQAWGPKAVEYLDGDFAFVVWDGPTRTAFCARDFGGKRPLHYAQLGGELVVASTIGGVVAHPRCPTELNLPVIAGSLAGMHFSAGPETCWTAVNVLPHAHRMTWRAGRTFAPDRYWEAPVVGPPGGLEHDEAAGHLLDLLATAVRERLQPGAANTVWMSGGWDSTAVFGAAQHEQRHASGTHAVLPVSISYPVGDPGREDEWIQAIADRWNVPVHWIDIADVPLLEHEPERAAARDEPYAHLYERWNGALAAGSRACGARVALDGNGGDQLFQGSDVFLADLFRSGRWLRLAAEWRARPRGGWRPFFATVIQPNLPSTLHRVATRLRGGRRLRHYLERRVPAWVRPDTAARYGLAERDLAWLPRPVSRSLAMREIDWLFTAMYPARAFASIGTSALREGVEVRSPLSDRRVIEFALSRPWWERSSGRETKRLLRRAMRGLLPDEVLAPRPHRTGVTGGYSHRWMVDVFPGLLEQTMRSPMLLEELGLIRSDELRRSCAAYPRRRDAALRVDLYDTLQAELWLRALQSRSGESIPLKEDYGPSPLAALAG